MKSSPLITLVLSLVFGAVAVFGARFFLGGDKEEEPQTVEARGHRDARRARRRA